MTLGLVIFWGLAHFLAVVFICSPVESQWDLNLTGKCGDQIKLFQSLIITNIVTDLVIMFLPIYSSSFLMSLLDSTLTQI